MPSRKYMMRNEKPLKPQKTVFILGAGFSIPAGGPNQALLLQQIFHLGDRPSQVCVCKKQLRRFLIRVLKASSKSVNDVLLEDIYTPIDRCLADGVSLRDVSPRQLQTLRGQMEYLITVAIDRSFNSTPRSAKQYAVDFAAYLVSKASHRAKLAERTDSAQAAKDYDPFSIISLNWD